jgi:hypothetical protein
LPIHFLQTFLANGALFEHEFQPTVLNAKKSLKEQSEHAVQVIAHAVSDIALQHLHEFIIRSKSTDRSTLPSDIAAAMLYKARVRVLKNQVHDSAINSELSQAL